METMMVAGKELAKKEYQGRRVVTFRDIDLVHERPEGTAKRNFNENKDKFIEGEDYFLIGKSQKWTDKVGTKFGVNLEEYGFNKFAPNGILVTETGYLMIVKSLTDDLAWKVQRELVSSYFRAKTMQNEELLLGMMAHMQAMMSGTTKALESVVQRLERLEQQRESRFHTGNVTSVVQIDYDENVEAIRVGLMLRGKRSQGKMDRIDEVTRKEVHLMILDGVTYEEIAEFVQSRGYDISSKSVARYGKKVCDLMKEICK